MKNLTMKPSTRRLWLISTPVLVLFAGLALSPVDVQADARVYKIKAAYILKFFTAVTWPDSAFSSADAPLVLGIVGDNPFGPMIEAAVKGKSVGGHPLQVKQSASVDGVKDAHILFIPQSQEGSMSDVLGAVKGSPVLTVSEVEGFAGNGGMINLLIVENKVKMEANPANAKAAGLSISDQLLQRAEVVN